MKNINGDLEETFEFKKKLDGLRKPIMNNRVLEVDEVSGKRSKRLNQKAKGNNFERKIAMILQERYGMIFKKTQGSGSFGTTQEINEVFLDAFMGDIQTHPNFLYTIECKKGYDDIDLMDLFFETNERGGKKSSNTIQYFYDEIEKSCEKSGKSPLIIWSKTRKPIICAVKNENFELLFLENQKPLTSLEWRGYTWFRLSEFLALDDSKVFKKVID